MFPEINHHFVLERVFPVTESTYLSMALGRKALEPKSWRGLLNTQIRKNLAK